MKQKWGETQLHRRIRKLIKEIMLRKPKERKGIIIIYVKGKTRENSKHRLERERERERGKQTETNEIIN